MISKPKPFQLNRDMSLRQYLKSSNEIDICHYDSILSQITLWGFAYDEELKNAWQKTIGFNTTTFSNKRVCIIYINTFSYSNLRRLSTLKKEVPIKLIVLLEGITILSRKSLSKELASAWFLSNHFEKTLVSINTGERGSQYYQ